VEIRHYRRVLFQGNAMESNAASIYARGYYNVPDPSIDVAGNSYIGGNTAMYFDCDGHACIQRGSYVSLKKNLV